MFHTLKKILHIILLRAYQGTHKFFQLHSNLRQAVKNFLNICLQFVSSSDMKKLLNEAFNNLYYLCFRIATVAKTKELIIRWYKRIQYQEVC